MTFVPRPVSGRTDLPVPAFVWIVLALICLPIAAMAGLSAAHSPTLVVMGLGGIAVFALSVLSPPASIAGLLLAAGFVRLQLGTGTGSPIVASLLVALAVMAAWAVRMIFLRNLHLVRSPVTFPLIAFVTTNVVSFFWSRATIDPRISVPPTYARVQIAALMVIVLSAGVVLLIGDTVRQRRWFAIYLGILLAIGVLHAALQIRGGGLDRLVEGRGLIPMWCICLGAAQAVINTRLRWLARVGMACAAALCFYGLLVHQDWISGWLPAALSLLVVFLLRGRIVAALTLIAAAILLVVLWSTIYQIFTVDKVNQGTLGGNTKRTVLWQRTLSTITPSPWLGSGPAGYALAEVQFYPNDALSTHSNYIDVIAESGVIGLGFFAWFLGATLFVGYRAQRTLRARGDTFGGALAVGALGGFVGILLAMALGDWVIPFVYNQTIAGFSYTIETWIGIGMLVALDAISRSESGEA
jgi:O-antigen ligase